MEFPAHFALSSTFSVENRSNSHIEHSKSSDDDDLDHLVLWRQPIRTLFYAFLQIFDLILRFLRHLFSYRKTLFSVGLFLISSIFIYKIDGSHQTQIQTIEHLLLWSFYWFGLGIASSIGFGTGLHTFLLYLGPFIAHVTLAAYECGSLDFPRPPYPNEIVCPTNNATQTATISVLKIFSKVKFEGFLWGLGTAFGELPPYFMARAARTGQRHNNEELQEFDQLIHNEENHSRHWTFFENVRYSIYRLIKRIGFFGILLCASIPNPLFDLAGLTCGYFLISFWQFFFATIIGKALIKMSIQTIFIIVLFSDHHVEYLIRWIKDFPSYSHLFQDWLNEQKQRMHRKSNQPALDQITNVSLLTRIFDLLVMMMIVFFIVSILNSLAQRYYRRMREKQKIN